MATPVFCGGNKNAIHEYIRHKELIEKIDEFQLNFNTIHWFHIKNSKEISAMKEHTFKVGDVVRLKSGEVKMTISQAKTYKRFEHKCECDWFADNILRTDVFAIDTLELVKKRQPTNKLEVIEQLEKSLDKWEWDVNCNSLPLDTFYKDLLEVFRTFIEVVKIETEATDESN